MKAFKRIFALILSVMIIAGTMVTAFALPPAPTDEFGNELPYTPLQGIEITPAEGDWKYEDYFVEYLNSQYENETFKYYYREVYESYPAVGNPSTPDYVLVECYKDYIDGEGDYSVNLGKYEIKGYYRHRPYKLGYFIFVPETEKIYTLEEAVNSGIKCYNGIERISHNPIDDIYDYCEFPVGIPGGGTFTPPDVKLLGSEKGAEIYELVTTYNSDRITHTVGDWEITGNDYGSLPYSYSIFVYYKSEVYELDEALEKGIVTDIYCVNQTEHTKVENKALNNKCKYAYLNHLKYTPTPDDTVYCKALGKIRSHIVFSAYVERKDVDYPAMNPQQIIGNYLFRTSGHLSSEENPIHLYVLTSNGDVLSALQAYKSGLVSDEELAKLANGKPCDPYDPYELYTYDSIIIPKVKETYLDDKEYKVISYTEIYKHYSETNKITPKYVLFNIDTDRAITDIPHATMINDYLIYDREADFDYTNGVYIPKTNEIISLKTALKRNIEGIDKAFEHISYSALIGDNNNDGKLSIKDATYLQKCLAGMEQYREDDPIYAYEFDDRIPAHYISDYNRDGVRNIRDATAIQKKLAKITE